MHRDPDHIVNPQMVALARDLLRTGFHKQAFVPGGGDPAAGGAPPPDPSGGGGAPPMDPSMMGGMPPPPAGGGGGDPALTAKLDQILQALQGGGMGGPQSGQAAGGMLKPKIDVNVEIMQIKHMLAKVIDSMGIPVSAQEMTATPEKLTQMAQAQQGSGQQDAAMGGGGGGQGAIPPMPPMDSAAPPPGGAKQGSDRYGRGVAFDTTGLGTAANRAAAIMKFRRAGTVA